MDVRKNWLQALVVASAFAPTLWAVVSLMSAACRP
jgi:hypothetical protein